MFDEYSMFNSMSFPIQRAKKSCNCRVIFNSYLMLYFSNAHSDHTVSCGCRPTIFVEIIQRIGCMMRDEQGEEYQRGGCGGFGKGNFSELFKCIEEYEKSLEAKQQSAALLSASQN